MFEKEAEEWVPNIKWHAYSSKEIREEMMRCYRKGAEYGYNKSLEEATHNYNAIIADYDKRIAELENEIGYAKTIIKDLLDNSDEYARQRAMDFLKEIEK